jgi:SAM-dependent methyltransferase
MSIFSNVDGSEEPGSASRYLDEISAVASIKRGKLARDALLGLRPGSVVLDVGCGLGVDIRRMAAAVGADGRAVGADASRALLDEARSLPAGDLVEWCLADAAQLPYPDAEFDAVRIERVLEHMADPAAAVSEAVRVARPGGRVCLCEPDWGTLVVGGLDLETSDEVRRVMSRTVRNPFIGRDLPSLVVDAAPTVSVEVHAEVVAIRDASTIEELSSLSLSPSAESTAQLRTAGVRGYLLAMMTQVTVLARC